MVIKAVITTLDNLPMLKQQVAILCDETLDEIIVVNNGSEDGTAAWLGSMAGMVMKQAWQSTSSPSWKRNDSGIIAINRPNYGAGPGRNAGLDVAGEFDHVLMLDGGIRPLRGGVAAMLAYLERCPEVDVVSPEIATCFTSDESLAHRRMVKMGSTFPQRALSSTAYALCNAHAWDGLRFSEEGPFARPGWGVDDNEMACRWNEAGIVHHDFGGVKLLRRQSGSFVRLFRETGIWPNQYGSVYEQRNVLLAQIYPQYYDPIWRKTDLQISCVLVGQDDYPAFVERIKVLHEELKDIPHEIIFVDNASTDKTRWWLDTFALRWPHGNTTIDPAGEILRRGEQLETIWTGNVVRVDLAERVDEEAAWALGVARARGKEVRIVS